ncbi:MAG: DUF3471 domain-containing protein, partial [Blastocatellia bacterium]
ALYDKYAGQYQFMPGMTLTITREGDHLMGQVTGQPKVEFYPESEMKFFLKVIDGELTFVKNDKGEVQEVVFTMGGGGGTTFHGKKVVPVASAN